MPAATTRDLLTCFSPFSDFYAISPGDGRIKIWDTVKGHLQTEFADLAPQEGGVLQAKSEKGHLSIDYTCMQWVRLGKKKKRKPGDTVLVLGTGSGDLLALDVSAAQLKWKVSDCHPGGVCAISFSRQDSIIHTAGSDGMVCQVDSTTGNLLGKFKASTKAISSLSISADGKLLAIASAQVKVFQFSDNKKIQKFSGHPVGVRCMTFSEDGKHILSSAVGERFIAIWKIDGSKNSTACCVLSAEHPAVSLDCKGFVDNRDSEDTSICILSVSENGLCYFWHGKNINELSGRKPTKISISAGPSVLQNKVSTPAIYSAKILSIVSPATGCILISYGSIVKPSFDRLTVQYGTDSVINSSEGGSLLPIVKSLGAKKDRLTQFKATALDRANAEDAVIPLPKLHDYVDKKRKHKKSVSTTDLYGETCEHEVEKPKGYSTDSKVFQAKIEDKDSVISMEDKLKEARILGTEDGINAEGSVQGFYTAKLDAALVKKLCLLVDSDRPSKKGRETLLSTFNDDAFKLLGALTFVWKSRSLGEHKVLPWICNIIANHSFSITSHESCQQILDELHKMTRFKSVAVEPLLQLSGRIQLMTAQIDKSSQEPIKELHALHENDESDDEEQEDDIDEVIYGRESEFSSEDD